MQEDVINESDGAGGQHKREGSCTRYKSIQNQRGGGGGIVQEDITEGRDGEEGGHYKREG